ncbi:hypothetical protein MATL_G00167940 [Megalops atlanticus]|uniref:THAP-type domain-containing protein n=1 Tax=Megalops atlanticus TaxID=7932 RepID=A0A9D3T0G7_MEGAT|nr:hypothetical protein MATL_G00167940 [Megalops atlanticus]
MSRKSGRTCAVLSCSNSSGKLQVWKKTVCEVHKPLLHEECPCPRPYSLHRFPGRAEDQDVRQKWIKNINRKDFVPNNNSTVCGIHFLDGKPTKENPYPVLHMGYECHDLRIYRNASPLSSIHSDQGEMPSSCVAINCSVERSPDTLKQGITFHRFPKDPVRRLQWCSALRRQSCDRRLWAPTKNSVLCSLHFAPDMFDRTGQTVRLRDSAVPTLFDFRKRKREGKVEPERPEKARDWPKRGKRARQEEQAVGRSADSPASLGDLALAAELMEVVSDTVQQVQLGVWSRRGFLNDHGCLPIPTEPGRLCALVHGLAKDQHRQEQALLSLQKAVEGKDKLLQKKKVRDPGLVRPCGSSRLMLAWALSLCLSRSSGSLFQSILRRRMGVVSP